MANPSRTLSKKRRQHRPEAPVGLTSAQVHNEPLPLFDLIQARKMEPLTAGALMAWPTRLFEQSGVPSDAFFQRMHNGRISLDLVLETALGSVGIFSMPLTTSQVRPGEASLLDYTGGDLAGVDMRRKVRRSDGSNSFSNELRSARAYGLRKPQ